MTTIVDYGLGNIGAFLNMYKRMNLPAKAARTAEELRDAERIILPGVGAFDHAIELLDASGMRPLLEEKVIHEKVPVIGVCVGMQILADTSEEGEGPGLGWIPGIVRHFRSMPAPNDLPLPHMGWNDVEPRGEEKLFRGLERDARFYFLHSFYYECANLSDRVATATYGSPFACAVRRDNVWGVQFHPEKSHHFGAMLLKNFAEI
ncbi:imidazole glycerol phosphate synthase subunit HisH [Allosphingosinicella flava]|uniref:Imidazole glycerol phosphate synthase subunit HisH n=1 Tax=Allosphingosinicella flava TaxID=2771430 RepID=A0A7T2LLE8_9SPHN|nr:imidazole glycerol phosphate synthase subunit HisH [Sphingosinicella flava]QPQ54431.1 imidazole glycerol phosphate synthase subunit HisH [Sphingosinicella flava]